MSPHPQPLSRDRILECAVQVADRDGLDAASLRRVASELGVHVTSLYNHLPTKDALLDGLVERLFATADLPLGSPAWDDWVRQYVAAVARLARRHPGAFAVMLRRPVQGPRSAATYEAGIGAFRRAGFNGPAAYAAVKSVALGALGCCLEQAFAVTGDVLETDVTALSWQDFPELHRVRAEVDQLDVVQTLVDVLVEGLRHQLPRRPRTTTKRRRTT